MDTLYLSSASTLDTCINLDICGHSVFVQSLSVHVLSFQLDEFNAQTKSHNHAKLIVPILIYLIHCSDHDLNTPILVRVPEDTCPSILNT